jgi:hypothetical protein
MEDLQGLKDLKERLEQFIEINSRVERYHMSEWEKTWLDSQTAAFTTVLTLIKQLKKKGKIWRGGYDDSLGKVIYTDQVGEILTSLREKNGQPSN